MDDFGLWDVFISMFWFMLLLSWIWLIISILGDIFRDGEMSGGSKALWTLFLIFFPWLGAIVYLIVRGGSMNERSMQIVRDNQAQARAYIKEAAGAPGVASELRDLAGLREGGTITAEEYEQAKHKILS